MSDPFRFVSPVCEVSELFVGVRLKVEASDLFAGKCPSI